MCKIHVVNLNKQAKLFSQGMHPVTRVGDTGPFERMKDSPTFFVSLKKIYFKNVPKIRKKNL